MKALISLALVLVLGGGTSCLANTDFLRVSVDCPPPSGTGILKTIDEKPDGNQSRVLTSYIPEAPLLHREYSAPVLLRRCLAKMACGDRGHRLFQTVHDQPRQRATFHSYA